MSLIIRLRSKGLPSAGSAATMLQLLSALTFINARFEMVSSTLSPEMTIDNAINENYANAVSSLTNDPTSSGGGLDGPMEKRTWQQLQSAWGKRADVGPNGWSIEPTGGDAILAERWTPVLTVGGGPLAEDHPAVLKYSMIYLTNAAALEKLADRHQAGADVELGFGGDEGNDLKLSNDLFASLEQSDNENILNEKRNWKSMNAAWGKRRNAPAWNKFRGAWGKREPGWNNLKGMWGKRSKDWQKLHAGWGKRSSNLQEMN